METVQVSITRPSGRFTPVQHNTTISGSYNNSTRNNQGSNNRIFKDGGRTQQDTETGGWEGIKGNVRRHDPLSSSKSDGDQWEPHVRGEHEAIGTSHSAPPTTVFAQPQTRTRQPPPNSSIQLDTQPPQGFFRQACPTCRQPWPLQPRVETMHDNDRFQSSPHHQHPDYTRSIPSTHFDDVAGVQHPFEDKMNRYWPAERTPPTYDDDQVQPLLFNESDEHDDRPASSQRIIHPSTARFLPTDPVVRVFQGNQSFRRSNDDPHFLLPSERPIESSAARPHSHLRYTSNEQVQVVDGQAIRFTGRSVHGHGQGRSELSNSLPPRRYERNVAVDYDIRVSAGGSRFDERLNHDQDSFPRSFDELFAPQDIGGPMGGDGGVFKSGSSTMNSHNPFRNRDVTALTGGASAAVGRTFFAPL